MPVLTLESQRRLGGLTLIGLIALLVVVIGVSRGLLGKDILPLTLTAACVTGVVLAAWRWDRGGLAAQIGIALGLMAQISLLVAAMRGHDWQVDLHMAYFAALATLVVFTDWRVILAGAAAVAVHHLIGNFVLSSVVFPGGGDLWRVILHAVILIVEAGVLISTTAMIAAMFDKVDMSESDAHVAREAAESAALAAETIRAAQAELMHKAEVERERAEGQKRVVEALRHGLAELAGGDLTIRIDQEFPADYLKLRDDFNAAVDHLHRPMLAITQSAARINQTCEGLDKVSSDIAHGAAQQAGSLEKAAESLRDVVGTATAAADGTRSVATVSAEARRDAQNSDDLVESAMTAMSGIESSSGQIGQIIGVIDEIAFQTNLLALNAGVEAARAGDAGRGFAVVAQEVRALAQRSADAAKQIKALISKSSTQVSEGVSLVGQAGETLTAMAQRFAQIDDLLLAVSRASDAQSLGVSLINREIVDMGALVPQNVALTDESRVASLALSEEAQSLFALVQRFRLEVASSVPGLRQAA